MLHMKTIVMRSQLSDNQMLKLAIFIISFILCFMPTIGHAQNQTVASYSSAKQHLKVIHSPNSKTFYCNCTYAEGQPDWTSCKFKPGTNYRRAGRIEWEHVVPASKFGVNFNSWNAGHKNCKDKNGKPYKGRKCASKTSDAYKFIEADLYNLQPVIGEINGARRNYPFGLVDGEQFHFGECDIEIENQIVEPPVNVRGDIARTYLYMDAAYPNQNILDPDASRIMQLWDQADPVDYWECYRASEIEKIQKNENKILKKKCSGKKWR